MFKDRLYEKIFGVAPRLIKVFPDESVEYSIYNPDLNPSDRLAYYSDAEVLFGTHTITDWVSWVDFLLSIGSIVIKAIFPKVGLVLTTVEACYHAFYGGAVTNCLKSEDISNSVFESFVDFMGNDTFSNACNWASEIFDNITDLLEALQAFTPSLSEVMIYNKVNLEDRYCVEFRNNKDTVTIKEVADLYKLADSLS